MAKLKTLSRIVEEVNILGTTFSIEYKDEVLAEDGDECVGLCISDEHRIEILDTPKVPYDSQLCTLLHECIEAVNAKLELNMKHSTISGIETGLFQLLRANPQLCKAFALYRKS